MSESWGTKHLLPELQAVLCSVLFVRTKSFYIFLYVLWLFAPEMWHETVECAGWIYSFTDSEK